MTREKPQTVRAAKSRTWASDDDRLKTTVPFDIDIDIDLTEILGEL